MIENNTIRGFTLVEMIVSIGLFSVAVLIIMSALFSLVNVQNKTVANQNVQDNLRFAFDAMVKEIRTGREFHCGGGTITDPADCPLGNSSFSFKNSAVPGQRVTYAISSGQLVKTSDSVSQNITAPGVTIDRLTFFVSGSGQNDDLQSMVTVVLRGRINDPKSSKDAEINLQTTISKRGLIDRP